MLFVRVESSHWADKHFKPLFYIHSHHFYRVLHNHLNSVSVTFQAGHKESQQVLFALGETVSRNVQIRNKACSVIFEMALLWEDSFLMSHFFSYTTGEFPCLLHLVTQARENMVEGKKPWKSFSWHCDNPFVCSFIHSFFQKAFVEQIVLGTKESGHNTGKVLALLELVFTWGDRRVGEPGPDCCSDSFI